MAELVFPDPDSFGPDWDHLWTGSNGLIYQWMTRGPGGNFLKVGYWNVVGTVGRQGPMGEPGPMGAPGLHPTISPSGTWVYNYQDYEPDGVTPGPEISIPTNHPSACAVRVLGVVAKAFINDLNKDDKWDERKVYNRNDAYMVEEYDDNDNPYSRLFMIPWHELVDGNHEPIDDADGRLAHSFADMGVLGAQGQKGDRGEQGKTGPKGSGKCQVVMSMPQGEEEGEMFIDKSTNTMFIAVNPVSG